MVEIEQGWQRVGSTINQTFTKVVEKHLHLSYCRHIGNILPTYWQHHFQIRFELDIENVGAEKL